MTQPFIELSRDPGPDCLLPCGAGAAAAVLCTVWLERAIERAPIVRPLAFAPPLPLHAADTSTQ